MSETIRVRLANPAAKLPLPGRADCAPAEPFDVPALDAFWRNCLADGSVVRVDPEPAAAPAPAKPVKSKE